MDNAKNQPLSSFIPPRHSGQTPVNLTLPRANEAPKTQSSQHCGQLVPIFGDHWAACYTECPQGLFACPWTTPTDTNNKLY
ncbi:hypothetical protein FOFC_01567 [Fusarium oxysporum]|nr:hypothetical protein FOFC_01567 [Fusarium oxysporum]